MAVATAAAMVAVHGRLDHQYRPRLGRGGADDHIQVAKCAHFFKDFAEKALAAVGAEAGFYYRPRARRVAAVPIPVAAGFALSVPRSFAWLCIARPLRRMRVARRCVNRNATCLFPSSSQHILPVNIYSFPIKRLRVTPFLSTPIPTADVGAETPPAARPKIAAAHGLTVDSAKVGRQQRSSLSKKKGKGQQQQQQKQKLLASEAALTDLSTSSPIPMSPSDFSFMDRSLLPNHNDLGSPQDDTDRSENDAGEIKYQYKNKKPDGTECGAIIKNGKHSIVLHLKVCRSNSEYARLLFFLSTPTADIDAVGTPKDGETKYRCEIKKPDGTECGAIVKNEKHSLGSHRRFRPSKEPRAEAIPRRSPVLRTSLGEKYRTIDAEDALNLRERKKDMLLLVSMTTPTIDYGSDESEEEVWPSPSRVMVQG
ncbi:hypothetical protein DL769_000884 [Monosporascus sp. CRB-8-3]|nr:hypothetical protein DL769_000884 [Monosporascus sp. CRB-8-3]